MARRTSRRMKPSSGYIGSGNRTEVFTRKPRKPFQDVPNIFKNKVSDNSNSKINSKQTSSDISETERKAYAVRIIHERRKDFIRNLMIFITIVLLGLLGFLWIQSL